MRLTAIEYGFGWGESRQTPQITLHFGQFATPELQGVSTQLVIELLMKRWPELGAYLFVGDSFGGNSNALETKLFGVRTRELAVTACAEVLFVEANPDTRMGLALLALPNAHGSVDDRRFGYSRLFMSPDIAGQIEEWRREHPSVPRLVELGAIVIEDDLDRGLLVLNLLCSSEQAADLGSLIQPFVDPIGLIAPLLDSGEFH